MNIIISEKEKKVLAGLYKLQRGSARDLARQTLINRTTLYPIVDKLRERGLVTEIKSDSKTIFQPISRKEFLTWAKRKEGELQKENETLASWIENQEGDGHESIISETKYFSGLESVKNLYHDSWRDNQDKTILSICDYESAYATLGDFFRKEYFPERIRHGVKVKSLLPKSSAGEKDAKNAKEMLREMKFIDLFRDLNIEINIYASKVTIIAFDKKNPTGVLIKNEKISSALREIFNYLWSDRNKSKK